MRDNSQAGVGRRWKKRNELKMALRFLTGENQEDSGSLIEKRK